VEKEELRLSAGGRIVEDVLPVLDNLALGLMRRAQPKLLVGCTLSRCVDIGAFSS